MEELGVMFRNDPTFDYIFHELPRGQFLKIVEFRKKRLETEPQLPNLF